MTFRTRRFSYTMLTALTIAALTSCGSGSDTDTAAPAESTAPAATTTDTPTTETPTTETPTTETPTTETPTTEPATAEPATTDAAPTTDFVLGADTVAEAFSGGFMTMDIWPGWELVSAPQPEVVSVVSEIGDPAWTFDFDAFDELATLTKGNGLLSIFREPASAAAGSYDEWRALLIDVLTNSDQVGTGTAFDDGPITWAGVDGDTVSFEQGLSAATAITVLTADVEGQYVGALYVGGDVIATDSRDQIAAMTENIEFDSSAVSPLAHATKMEFATSAAGPEFSAAVLVPYSWEMDPQSESLEFRDPLDGSNASITIIPSQGGLEETVAVTESLDFLDDDAMRRDGTVDGLSYAMLWDGPERDANKVLIVADDGVYGVVVLVETAVMLIGEPAFGDRLIDRIADSIRFDVHSG